MPVVTRWRSAYNMMHSLVRREASLKLAVSHPEFPSYPGSKGNAPKRAHGWKVRKVIDSPVFWDITKGIKNFTQPPSYMSFLPDRLWCCFKFVLR